MNIAFLNFFATSLHGLSSGFRGSGPGPHIHGYSSLYGRSNVSPVSAWTVSQKFPIQVRVFPPLPPLGTYLEVPVFKYFSTSVALNQLSCIWLVSYMAALVAYSGTLRNRQRYMWGTLQVFSRSARATMLYIFSENSSTSYGPDPITLSRTHSHPISS